MNLFEDEALDTNDWFDVCPNAEDIIFDEKKVSLFDAMRKWLNDYDRLHVRDALETASTHHAFMLDVMNATCPNDPTVMFAARELLQKESFGIMYSLLALSKDGSGRRRITFPNKAPKPVPNRLLAVFGLRPSEQNWFERIVAREENVRAVLPHLLDSDWDFIIHDKATLLKPTPKQATKSLSIEDWGSSR
jgi:hypothetical protein